MISYWNNAPCVRLVIPFGLGILAGSLDAGFFSSPLVPILVCGVFILVLVIFRHRWKEYAHRHQFGLLIFVVFTFLGIAAISGRAGSREADFDSLKQDVKFIAKVETLPEKREKSVRFELYIHGYLDSLNRYHHLNKYVMTYGPLDSGLDSLAPGDVVIFKDYPSKVGKPLNPGQFNYGAYLYNKGFAGTLYLRSHFEAIRPEGKSFRPTLAFQIWREKAIDIFRKQDFGQKELGVVSALVLGKRELVDPETRTAYADAGTVHILAVSGLHVGIIYLFLAFIFGKVLPGERLKLTRLLITLFLLWTYAGITGFSPSVLRAATMFSFIALGRHSGKFGGIYNMLGASAFVLLLANPFLIKEVGFQLSYMAVIGIVYLHPKIFPLLATGNWIWDKIWALAVVSFSAQLATFPLSIYYFNQFPNYFLFTNLLVIPLATLILYLGITALISSWIPYLGAFVALLLKATLQVLNEVIYFASGLPYAVTNGLYFSAGATVLIYLIIVYLIRSVKDPRHGNFRILGASISILLLMYAFSAYQRTTLSDITTFHINGQTAIAASNGGRVHVWTDLYPDNLGKLDFHLGGYLNWLRPTDITYSGLLDGVNFGGIVSKNNVIAAGEHIFVVAHDSVSLNAYAMRNADGILVRNKLDPEVFQQLIDQRGDAMLVIDGSVPFFHQKKLLEQVSRGYDPIWSTSVDGAFSMRISKGS